MIMATEDSKGTGWIQCDRCDTYFRPMGMTSDTRDGKTIYHYICPECGYHGTDEILHEGQNKEEIDMSNYYTVSNAASRLNVCRNTILRAIHSGLFTDTIRDTSFPGAPAYMIPSNQVEYFVSNGGILQIKSRKTKQKPSPVVPKPEKKEKPIDKNLRDPGILSISDGLVETACVQDRVDDRIELQPIPLPDPNKITIEIDASLIEKQISKRFRDQITNLRAAISMVGEELSKLEAML